MASADAVILLNRDATVTIYVVRIFIAWIT